MKFQSSPSSARHGDTYWRTDRQHNEANRHFSRLH